jgi:ABC-type Zn uptake system ZnuABC Zn-binding protein ZnuA
MIANRLPAFIAAALLLTQAVGAAETIRVVAATMDMADFARQVGGDRVEVHAITRGQ